MKYFILAILIGIIETAVIKERKKCVTIGNTPYEEELLKTNIHNPYQLAIDYDTNTLFFSYTARTSETFKIAYLSLKTSDYGLVAGINGGFANAIDSRSHIVYMGGDDGLYTFNYATKTATNLNIKLSSSNIWQMFYKDGLYFTTYPGEKSFLYKNEEVIPVPGLNDRTMLLAVKNDGTYIYSNSSGLFTFSKVIGKAKYEGDYVANGLTADINGNIYFSTPTELYSIDDKRNEIQKLASFGNIYGVAIEGNGNIIYATENSIIRLKPTKEKCLPQETENNVI